MKYILKLCATVLSVVVMSPVTMFAQDDVIALTAKDISGLYKAKNKTYAGIHDPSVVYDPTTQKYFIYGTHLGKASSTDLQNWTGLSNNFFGVISNGSVVSASPDRAFITNQTKKVNALVNGSVQEVNFGSYDAQAWSCVMPNSDGEAWSVYGNMWAPDIIYNKKMKKWCYYLSLNGPAWNCVIILMTSNSADGPFVYQGPVVYSGFKDNTDERIKWTKTDLPIVTGNNTYPGRYNVGGGWGTYWPNCIDPCVFYDDNGQLWMTYGSWSGGIFMFKLDESTGLRDYTVTYPYTTDGNGRATSDPYFGKRIAGGYYVSGEGSYIQKIGDYYYLFVTNGGLSAREGYVMRVFRSKNPDGPYVDGKGRSAVYSGYQMNYSTNDAETRGNLVVSSFNELGFQTVGQVAQGHNSAIVDDKGRAFVVYHTRFNTGNEGFQDRVHQLFVNKEGWLVTAPFEFNGETLTDDSIKTYAKFTDQQIAGEYQVHQLRYKLDNANLECVTPKTVKLNPNGTITGELSGKWSTTANTGYISVTMGGVTYSGVVLDQMYDGTTLKSISFTASSSLGTQVWGVKMQPQSAIAYNVSKITTSPVSDKMTITRNLDLTAETYFGVKYEWISSMPDVVSNTGKYAPVDENVALTLTNRLSCDNYVYDKTYDVTARADDHLPGDYTSGIVAYYDFDAIPLANQYKTTEKATFSKQSNGVTPVLLEDGLMVGKVGYVHGGTEENKSGAYLRMPNPLKRESTEKLDGATISLWVKRTDDNWFGTIWAFTEQLPIATGENPRWFLTSNNYMSYTNEVDTFCINYPKAAKNDITKDKWAYVTVTLSAEDGVTVYVNKIKRSKVFESNVADKSEDFDYTKVLETLKSAKYFSLGIGGRRGTADAYYDDLLIYDRALSKDDVSLLYSKATRLTDFTEPLSSGIEDISDGGFVYPDGIFDLSGRKLPTLNRSDLKSGIYIIRENGKSHKIFVK